MLFCHEHNIFIYICILYNNDSKLFFINFMSFLSFVGLHVEYTTEESRSYVQLAQSTQPGQTGTSCLGRYFAGGEETKVRKKVTNQDCTRCQI